MIISKTPLRISLGGGGTDIDSFWKKEDGFWLSGAINKFIYVVVKERFEKTIRVAYSALEYVEHPSELEHPIIREVLTNLNLESNIEIASFADLPSRIGLGSSGAFTVGLLNAIWKLPEIVIKDLVPTSELPKKTLVEEAYRIEHDNLGRPVGKQDQYSASFGNITAYKINKKGNVSKKTIKTDVEELTRWLSLFYIGRRKESTHKILKKSTFKDIQKIKELGLESYKRLQILDFIGFGKMMKAHWSIKKNISTTNKEFDKWIQYGEVCGAIGGKLVGAGAGGCILFVHRPEHKENIVKVLCQHGARLIPFKFYKKGSMVSII